MHIYVCDPFGIACIRTLFHIVLEKRAAIYMLLSSRLFLAILLSLIKVLSLRMRV